MVYSTSSLVRIELLCCNSRFCLREGQTVAAVAPHNQENVMRGIVGWLGVSVVAGLVLLAPVARADDTENNKKIPLDKVPKAVMGSIKARFPGADVTSVEKESENGKVVYDIELKHKGRKYEMDIHEDGTVIEIEKEVAAKNVPEAVTKAVKARYPRATIHEVMEVNKVKGKKETPDHYEVTLVTADKKELEIELSLDGKILKGGKD
jgi:uncharacterized membrane protein YkoI